jgi:hypothetical protein
LSEYAPRTIMRGLIIAAVSSAVALYFDVGIPLVALRAQRHFSAPAWVIVACIAVGATWIAVRSWRRHHCHPPESKLTHHLAETTPSPAPSRGAIV